jgi:hypothetical protein
MSVQNDGYKVSATFAFQAPSCIKNTHLQGARGRVSDLSTL